MQDGVNLRERLRSEYEGRSFVSIRFLEQHITVESVINHLRSQGITFSHDVQDLIAEGRRLFAILVLLEREHEVDAIFSRIQDDNLPFYTKEGIPPILAKSMDQTSAFWEHQAKFPPKLRL